MEDFRELSWRGFLLGYAGFNMVAALIGVIAGFGAIIFRYMISLFSHVFFEFSPYIFKPLGPYYVVLVPAIGGLIIGPIINFAARETKGHGVPEVMEAVMRRGGRIRARVSVVKTLVSSICIGSGGSAGREGPIVQIGSSAGSAIGQVLKFPSEQIKVLVACGGAGGIAATFNAPLAGTFFAMEVILGEFRTRSFIPIVVSTVMATIVSRTFLGDYPSFRPVGYSLVSPYELPLYLLLGLIAGFTAIAEIVVLYGFEDLFERLKVKPYILPAIGGLLLGIIGLHLPHVFGVGYGENLPPPMVNSIDLVLAESMEFKLMAVLIIAKIIALSLTLGSGGSGGVFAPTLFIGAMLGGSFGYLVHRLFPNITASYGAYALVGMGAVFSGASRATLTAITILFEMTRDYNIIVPLMFSCVVSDGIVVLLYHRTIYTEKLRRRGLRFRAEKEPDILDITLIEECMKKAGEVIKLKIDTTVDEAGRIMIRTGYHGFPVVDESGRLRGIVTHHEINEALSSGMYRLKVRDIMIEKPTVLYSDETLREALCRVGSKRQSHFPVVSREDPTKLLGFITKTDILKVYSEKVREIRWFPE